jgi:hypothetical protein
VDLGQKNELYDKAFFPNKLKLCILIAKFIIKSIKKIASYDRLALLRKSASKFRVGATCVSKKTLIYANILIDILITIIYNILLLFLRFCIVRLGNDELSSSKILSP